MLSGDDLVSRTNICPDSNMFDDILTILSSVYVSVLGPNPASSEVNFVK